MKFTVAACLIAATNQASIPDDEQAIQEEAENLEEVCKDFL